MIFNKKAISPVVATALLLVVAVVAVVGFQTWFTTYQSSQLVKVEQESDNGGTLSVERLEETNSKLYLKNSGDSAVTIDALKVVNSAGSECTLINFTQTTASANSVTTYTNSSCSVLTKGEVSNVVVQTTTGVVSVEMLVR